MSDSKNHKAAIKAIIEAHRTPGKMREIWLEILADKPSAIVNAWEKVKPQRYPDKCDKCKREIFYPMKDGLCGPCSLR